MWQELLDLRVGFRMQGKYGRYIQVGLGFGMRPQFFTWALGRGLASTIMHGLHVLALCYRRCSGPPLLYLCYCYPVALTTAQSELYLC